MLTCVEINQCVGTPDNSSFSHFSAMTWPRWLCRLVRNRYRHAIEQASRRWRGGRRGDSGRTRRTFDFHTGGISLLSLVIQYLQERALPRSVTGAKDPTAPTQSEGGIDRYQLSNAPEVAVTLERHSLSPYRLTLTDGL